MFFLLLANKQRRGPEHRESQVNHYAPIGLGRRDDVI
jgi:hypothetical protein